MSASNLLEQFLNNTIEAAELNTEYFLCPEFEEVPATIKGWELNGGTYIAKDGNEKPWASLQLAYIVDSEEARQEMKRDEVVVYGNTFLSLSDEGNLEPETNQALARLLKIFDLSIEGLSPKEVFDSLIGGYAEVKVVHVAMVNKEKEPMLDEDGEQRYRAEIGGVSRA